MRMSCNGCRVLRKGCSDSCRIRPCLQWIKSPEAQAHATVFLAKFYGRAGLLNLIDSGPDHLRPAIFRSLLYEACGRIVNPIYGSVGLLWSGSWSMVQAAVDAVLSGSPIVSMSLETAEAGPVPHLSYDIRHVSKAGPDAALHKVSKTTRTRFKRIAKLSKAVSPTVAASDHEPSHHSSEPGLVETDCRVVRRENSADTLEEVSHVSQREPSPAVDREDVCLNLTLGLGFEPVREHPGPVSSKPDKQSDSSSGDSTGACSFGLELQLRA